MRSKTRFSFVTSQPDGLFKRYILAVAIIGTLVTTSHMAKEVSLAQQDGLAEAIDISGRQRMLSQRIQLYATRLAESTDPQDQHQAMLSDAIRLFEQSHLQLINPGENRVLPPLSAELSRLYFGNPSSNTRSEVSLDHEVNMFIAQARGVLQAAVYEKASELKALLSLDNEGLLRDLDAAVSLFVLQSETSKEKTNYISRAGFILALLVLAVEVLLIFRPAHQMVQKAFRDLGDTNEKLIASEVVERKAREEAQVALVDAEKSRDEAKAAAKAKADFLANMSHEIRTPMNGVIGMTELLMASELNPEQKQFAQTINESAGSLLTVINDILDFSKIDAGKMKMVEEAFDLSDLIYSVSALLTPVASQKGLEICVDLSETMPTHFTGDPSRIRQCLMNIVGNAVKFTQAGHVSLTVKGQRDTGFTVEVRDTGIGVSAEKLETIFGAFEQADTSITRRFQGTGLGLAITKQLVELMGGTLEVSSVEGEGSCFTISLPLMEAPAPERQRTTQGLASAGKRVLVVDDLQLNRLVLERGLNGKGMTSVAVSDAKSAIELLASSHEPFDVMIFDYEMPDLNGAELLGELKAQGLSRDVPVILLSSRNLISRKDELTELGFASVLGKPTRIQTLERELCDAMGLGHSIAPEKSEPKESSVLAASGLTVMVADDGDINRKLVRMLLETVGVSTIEATNGQQAVELYQKERPDIILMDMSMPIMDGPSATRAMRNFEKQRVLPPAYILGCTANVLPDAQKEFVDAGVSGFLFKPVGKAALIEQLETFVSVQPEEKLRAKR